MVDTTVVISPNVSTVSLSTPVTSIITLGTQGPPGSFAPLRVVAGIDLGGHRGVIMDNGVVIYADSSDLTHAGKLIGITTGSFLAGASGAVVSSGELDGFSGLIINSKVYLQPNGVISSTIPTSGFLQQVGIASSTTKVLINIQPSLALG
jgi:hypothetical protein